MTCERIVLEGKTLGNRCRGQKQIQRVVHDSCNLYTVKNGEFEQEGHITCSFQRKITFISMSSLYSKRWCSDLQPVLACEQSRTNLSCAGAKGLRGRNQMISPCNCTGRETLTHLYL